MTLSSVLLYTSLFVSLFFEVFLLITYFEIREEIKFEKSHAAEPLSRYPSVSIIVPCFNEERTVAKTLNSLLALDYPKDSLQLIVVDDGSTDGTQKALAQFKSNPQVKILKKQNGGKHTALNLALKHIETELVGCLDADSFVAKDALQRIIPYFEDAEMMAVTPAVRIHEPETVLQHVQKIEYSWGILLRRILSSLDGLYVTPGPFSIFRLKVFKELGGYAEAHHTEDMEMALRMQKHGYKITNSPYASVYTVGPESFGGLYKQRVRWTYGFLNNAFDYREMFFNKKYGNIGLFILPVATFTIFSTLYAAGETVWHLFDKIPDVITKYQAVGFDFSALHLPHLASLSLFSLNTGIASLLTVVAVCLSITILGLALIMTEGGIKPNRGLVYYFAIYFLIVPLWLAKATYSTIARKTVTWR